MTAEQRLRLVRDAINAGRDLREVAQEHGVPLEDLQLWASVYALARADVAQRSGRRARTGLLVGVALLATGGALTASAQVATDSLRTFSPNSPALAADVNWNFALLKTWVEQKVGTTGTAAVTTTGPLTANGGVTTSALTVNGNPVFNGSDLVLHNPARGPSPGRALVHTVGNGLAINYLGDFSGGVTITGSTTIDGRRTPSAISTNECSSGSCTATCPAGTVIKLAFGFHGMALSSSSSTWVCGSAFQWKGECRGQTSCTVTTGCSTSSVWLECW